ncbi:unnamed protein product [Penicillium olsonii]|nr:unnamed protein product [Penicillium olsonii]
MNTLPSSSPADFFIAAGTVSVIHAVDENTVVKVRPSSGDFEIQAYDIEIRCYERPGNHKHIPSCEVTDKGLLLDRGTCLRGMIRSVREPAIPWALKLRWALEAAEGLAYIHSKGIVHADVGCHNIIVDNARHIKFIDFAGSGIDGEDPLVCYEWCSYQPGNEIGICTDIFAFGSMLFELETGRVPYSELEKSLDMGKLMTVVEELFSEQKFPYVDTLSFASVILGCWNGKYNSMVDVHRDIACCFENCSELNVNQATLDTE